MIKKKEQDDEVEENITANVDRARRAKSSQ